MALIIDERLLEPNGEVEITENFNRIMKKLDNAGSGSGECLPDAAAASKGDVLTINENGTAEWKPPVNGEAEVEHNYAADVDAFYENIPDEYKSAFQHEDGSRFYLNEIQLDGLKSDWYPDNHNEYFRALFFLYSDWTESFETGRPGPGDEFLVPYDASTVVSIYSFVPNVDEVETANVGNFDFFGKIKGTENGYITSEDMLALYSVIGQPMGLPAAIIGSMSLNSINSSDDLFEQFGYLIACSIDENNAVAEAIVEAVKARLPNAEEATF